MKKRVDYKHLRTLADVQAQRLRIARELAQVEMRLEEDYRRIDAMFSMNFLLERIANSIGRLYSILEWAKNIYASIRVLMTKYRATKAQANSVDAETNNTDDTD